MGSMMEQISLWSAAWFKKTAPPRAEKEHFVFLGHKVEVVRRPYRRSMGLLVKPDGRIRLSISKTTSEQKMAEFLDEKKQWLEHHLAEFQRLRARYPQKHFREAEVFPFLGQELVLRYFEVDGLRYRVLRTANELQVFVPSKIWSVDFIQRAHPELRALIVEYYAREGRQCLAQRVEYWAEKMGLYPTMLQFRSQKTRWGSCASSGTISLNWRLIVAPPIVIDYVVVHELAHLAQPNHSRRFWQLVERQLPEYREHRLWLNQNHLLADFLSKQSELK